MLPLVVVEALKEPDADPDDDREVECEAVGSGVTVVIVCESDEEPRDTVKDAEGENDVERLGEREVEAECVG